MALQAVIQTKYNKATEAYGAARAILDEFADKPLPEEKSIEVDKAFAAFDGFIAEAKRLERAAEAGGGVGGYGGAENGMEGAKGMAGRPGEGGNAEDNTLYMKAWDRALRGGTRVLTGAEAKALRADNDPAGGFLVVAQQVGRQVLQAVVRAVLLRRQGAVVPWAG